jgi:hypothetical protein
MLDYKQLAHDAVKDGGFTVDLDGNRPQSGYAVSLAGYERKFRLPRTTTALAHALYLYVVDNGRALRDPGAHFGAWIDGATVYLDVTHIFTARADAEFMARANRQIAFFDIENAEEIRTKVTA